MAFMEYFSKLYRESTIRNYDELIEHHTHNILSSGLILDDDMEIFVAHWDDEDIKTKSKAVETCYIFCSIPIVCTAFLKIKFDISRNILITSCIPLTGLGVYDLCITTMKSKYKRNIENLTGNLIKIYKLNQTVLGYLKVRKNLSSTDTEHFLPYSKCVAGFMNIFFETQAILLNCLIKSIKKITYLLPLLNAEYNYINDINLNFKDACSNIEESLSQTQKVCNTYLLLVSNFLCSLILTFCKKLWDKGTDIYMDIQHLVNNINNELLINYKVLRVNFDKVRYSVEAKQEKLNIIRRNKLVSSKLQQSLIDSITNLYIILEKSQAIMRKLEKVENEQDFKNLGCSIMDLRNHSFGCYESLDILCRLYEVILKTAVTQKQKSVLEEAINVINEDEKETTVQIIKFDDPNEPVEDEEYELYIGEDENNAIEHSSEYYEYESGQYLYLMLEELRQSLKNHKAFIFARKKRGIVDPEPEQMEKEKIGVVETVESNTVEFEKVNKQIDDLPVPPPPPLPEQQKSTQCPSKTCNSFLDAIKLVSKQRNQVEECFGDSCSEEET